MKAAFYTLGCKVNQYETQEMFCQLKNNGFEITDSKNSADIYIINSCTVTAESTRKTRQAVRRFKNKSSGCIIVLTGCFPQAFPDEAAQLEECDIILGNNTNNQLADSIKAFKKNRIRIINIKNHQKDDKYTTGSIDTFHGHTRAFIKIQDGCNRYCSYCTIPKARGFSRSRPLDDIKKEIEALARDGYKEIVFVGINLSAYGIENNTSICDAVEIAENTEGIERIRLGSLEPDHITDEVISRLHNCKKFCPQFHLSLQSGSDRILKKMNRHYTSDQYLELCNKLHNTFNNISLTTDIIVGFPGETDEDFNTTLEFAKKCNFMKVHVFPFSARKGTVAYNYDNKIPNCIKEARCSILQKKCDETRSNFMKDYIDKEVRVLFESPKNELQQGYTENYTPVFVKHSDNLCGKIITVKITDVNTEYCEGILV